MVQQNKQFDLLIRAFNAIKDHHTQWELVILGEGEERLELKRLVDELEMSNRINLPGSVGNISEWYERADLFVLSSSVEGFPNVLLEAIILNKQVIATKCPGQNHYSLSKFKNCYILKKSSIINLAEIILFFLKKNKMYNFPQNKYKQYKVENSAKKILNEIL